MNDTDWNEETLKILLTDRDKDISRFWVEAVPKEGTYGNDFNAKITT